MESSNNNQTSYKSVKIISHSTTPRLGRLATPQQAKNHSSSREEMKEIQRDKVKVAQKNVMKEHTKPVDFRLHTQQRAVSRAIFNYTVATNEYLMERQKKQVKKLQKMIEEEEVKMLRKEMVHKAQSMPLFNKPFSPQRSTRPLTVPKEPKMMSDKCSSRVTFYNLFSLRYNNTTLSN